MKSHRSVISVFIIFFIAAFTLQKESTAQTKLGITTGFTLSTISGDAPDNSEYSSSSGLVLGLTGEFNITKDLKINLQPQYFSNNSIISYDLNRKEPIDSLKLNFQYISLPIILKVPALSSITYFNSGFSISYLMNSKITDIDGADYNVDLNDLVNKFNLAILFGVGLNFPVYKQFELEFEARYTQSILNLSNGSTSFVGTLPDRYRSSGFMILADIIYSFK
ncbi:MAG TPA: porin family protein [Ignavibacteria bacterium]|nr:porin family protein [Ignavibacteria bacterium]HQY51537.1 porin family protein [Ignavibacteria bacterium]